MRSVPISRLPASWPLAPIVLMAGVLRLAGLPSRGLLYWDEGKFALEGIRLLAIARSLPTLHAASIAGKAVGTAKPMHALFIAVAYALLGVHDYAPLYLDAFASLASVVVLYGLVADLVNRRTGLVAAAFLAVSGYDVVYARSALSESDAALLFLVAVHLWWRAHRSESARLGLAAGVVLGAAFTTNYRISVYAFGLVAAAVVVAFRASDRAQQVRVLVASFAGTLVLPLCWELAGIVAQRHGVVLFRSEITNRPTSYIAEALYQIHGGKQAVVHFDPRLYLQWYVIRQGWPLALLTGVGLLVAAMRRTVADLLLITLVVLPFAIFAFASFIVPRNLDAALPFASALAAIGLVDLAERYLPRTTLSATVAMAALGLAATGAAVAAPTLAVHSGFVRAAIFLRRHHIDTAVVDNEVMEFYMRDAEIGCDGQRLPRHVGQLRADVAAGARMAIITDHTQSSARFLAARAVHVATFRTMGSAYHGEDLVASENGLPPTSTSHEQIHVYSIVHLHVPQDTRLHRVSCSLDTVV
jgi:4-amino-4-deoxy-L-arabinose transferase-like glycosyltransferase